MCVYICENFVCKYGHKETFLKLQMNILCGLTHKPSMYGLSIIKKISFYVVDGLVLGLTGKYNKINKIKIHTKKKKKTNEDFLALFSLDCLIVYVTMCLVYLS